VTPRFPKLSDSNSPAPGDDGAQGTAFKYDLRYSTEPITGENWQYATPLDSLPDPQTAGSTETATVSGLDAGTTYYFAIKARDDSWQESSLSQCCSNNHRDSQSHLGNREDLPGLLG
jgi:hypothetical protein